MQISIPHFVTYISEKNPHSITFLNLRIFKTILRRQMKSKILK
jgi:hypothetical protein